MTTGPVVGIDPSLRSAGIAILKHPTIAETPNRPELLTLGEAGRKGDSHDQRTLRVKRQAVRLNRAVPDGTALVVIEGLSYGSQHGMSAERIGVYFLLQILLRDRKIPIAVCPPQTRAKFATGSGVASKTDVLDAMRHHWPTAQIRNDNESDALALATAGGMRMLWWPTEADHHEAAMGAIEWPEQVKVELAQRIKAGW